MAAQAHCVMDIAADAPRRNGNCMAPCRAAGPAFISNRRGRGGRESGTGAPEPCIRLGPVPNFCQPVFLSPSTAFAFSTKSAGFTVISAQAGKNPLFTAFLADGMFDHAQQ